MVPTTTLRTAIGLLALSRSPSVGAFAPPSARPVSMALAPQPPSSTATRTSRSTRLSAVREATFGMGCFWEPAESLLKQPGVLATTAGYTGAPANKPPPTYDAVCFGNDWVEAVRVAYDDELVSYNQLLDYFFELQKPAGSRQYASIVFANDAAEEGEARRWREEGVAGGKPRREDGLPHDIVQIEPLSAFFKAEGYHQRYWEKQRVRFAIGFALIAGESGAYDGLFDGKLGNLEVFGLSFDSVCGSLFIAGAAWTLLERLVARDVTEMKRGDLIAMAVEGKS